MPRAKVTIIANWVVAPPLVALYANLLLSDPTYKAGVILLTMIAWIYPLGYYAGWPYEATIDTTLVGSSSHFEVAIYWLTCMVYGVPQPVYSVYNS